MSWVFKLHMVLGMTVFLVFPFTRLVHVWSGFASLVYLGRPYQLVRSRRLGVPAAHRSPAPQPFGREPVGAGATPPRGEPSFGAAPGTRPVAGAPAYSSVRASSGGRP